jgi:protein gp37
MGKTTIEWTDASWNPVTGCREISPGCANCYAARLAATRLRNHPDYRDLANIVRVTTKETQPQWTGEVHCNPHRLEEPLHWRKPRKIFVCDMSDLFHEAVPDEFIRRVFKTMALAGSFGHTFQVLTKRAARLRDFMRADHGVEWVRPMPWVWFGVSVENQHFADERIPALLATPAAVRFISAEPLLGPVDLTNNKSSDGRTRDGITTNFLTGQWWDHTGFEQTQNEQNPKGFPRQRVNWVICGGESGPGARPMHPDWARSLRDQCQASGVAFFFKQWGEYLPPLQDGARGEEENWVVRNCGDHPIRIGKKAAGRRLDGREWNEFPIPR